jgi:CTP:molybdopterin cytidylyltransferase MocA
VTVAAVMLFENADGALADTGGRPAVRRMVESAWAGGATPIVVLSHDPEGHVSAALAGSPAILAEPAPAEAGPAGQFVRGVHVAAQRVVETEAALLWPGRMAWVDAETVTTLIEAHGMSREAVLRPRYGEAPGWPVLLPVTLLASLAAVSPALSPAELADDLAGGSADAGTVDTGDPGAAHDISTGIDDLPDFEGPPEPVKAPPDWGAEVEEMGDEGPLQGPALAPYGQAADEPD